MEHSLYDNVSVVVDVASIILNNDTEGTGAGVDLAGYETAIAIVNVGISADTLSGSVYHSVSLQDSADGITYADVAAAFVEGSSQPTVIDAAAEDPAVLTWGYKGSKRYIRTFNDTTGTHTTGTPYGAVVVKGRPRHIGTAA